ncbi:DUF488 domain-containing protein [Pseudolysinimonas sp.]
MEIFSAGTSGTSAQDFFERLRVARVTTVVDTRLHPSSQLAAFAKARDLRYFLKEILGIDYLSEPLLMPEDAALKAYRRGVIDWATYEARYQELLHTRFASERITPTNWGERPLLLCSEPTPHHCHRRLAAEYLVQAWGERVRSIHHL